MKHYEILRDVKIKDFDKTERFLIDLTNLLLDIKKDLSVEEVPDEKNFSCFYIVISKGIWDPSLEVYGTLNFSLEKDMYEKGFFNQSKFLYPVLILKSKDLRFSDYSYCISLEDDMEFDTTSDECVVKVYGVYNNSNKMKRIFRKILGKD